MIICEALFVVFGLYALLAGKIRLIGKRSVVGSRARTIGLILLAPVIFAFCSGMVVGAVQGSNFVASDVQNLVIVEIGAMILAVIASLVLASNAPETPATVIGTPSTSFPVYGAPSAPTVLTVQEAADYLRVPPAEVSQLIETGQLTARQIGTEYRISKESLDNFLNNPKS